MNTRARQSISPVGATKGRSSCRYNYAVAAALTILGGAVPRLDSFGRSLWAAEAWVANSVLADTLHGMFYYEKWLQTTPPLFLLLVRASVGLFGLSDYSLRAVPLLLSIAALVLIASLARKMFGAPFAVLCVALMALSPSAILFSKELKQYSGDVFATCAILITLWNYLQSADRQRYLCLLLTVALMLTLSYTAVVFVPLALLVVALAETQGAIHPDRWRRLRRCGGLALLTSAMSCIDYVLFIKPNTSPLLNAFWDHGFPSFAHFGSVVRFYVEDFVAMGIYFYFPAQSSFNDTLKAQVVSLPSVIQFGIGISIILLAATIAATMRRERGSRLAALFFFVPFLTLIAMNVAHLYPVGSRRLTLFMLPCVVIVTTASIEALWKGILMPLLTEKSARRVLMGTTVLCVSSVWVLGARAAGWDVDWSEDEDTESAFRYLRSNVEPTDTIYVHTSVEEAARLYFRMLHWNTAHVVYGNTGLPCCKRQPEVRPEDATDRRSYVVHAFEDVVKDRLIGSVWVVFTARTEHWQYLNMNEAAVIQGRLVELGCTKQREKDFENEVVAQFQCKGTSQ